MSEYQYLHFVACDRPLDDAALEYMEMQSTRANISRWEFTNEYHYSGFRGNAQEMLRRGYDVHLHFANFGIRKLMFRLPDLPCDKKTFAAFEVEYGVAWEKDKRGKAGILSIAPESDAGTYDYLDHVHSFLSRLAPLRDMLLRGDLRPLYLAWLACGYDEESMEPPVPAGLGQLDAALESMAEFYELPSDLLAAAAQQSPPAPKQRDRKVEADKWVCRLSKAELQQVVSDLITGDPVIVQADLLNHIRQSAPAETWPVTQPARTLEQLRTLAESIGTQRQKDEAVVSEKARKKYLKSIAGDPKKTIRRIDSLVSNRSRQSYHQVADCLSDLAEALGADRGPAKASQIAQRLRTRKPRSNVLIGILRKRGWIE